MYVQHTRKYNYTNYFFISSNIYIMGEPMKASIKYHSHRILAATIAALLIAASMTGCTSDTSGTTSSPGSAADAAASPDAASDTAADASNSSGITAGGAGSADGGASDVSANTPASGAAASSDGSQAISGGTGTSASDSSTGAPLTTGTTGVEAWFDATGSMELSYASEFSVDYDGEGRALIRIGSDQSYLLLPEDVDAPEGMPDGITAINQPISGIYAASTSTLDLLGKCGSLGQVKLVGTEYKSWTIQSVRDAMDRGDIAYAGKYSAPDFELIAVSDIDLVLENSDIYHSADTLDKLRELGYTVMIERMSAETHPLGRVEWIKLMGLLTGHADEAETAFAEMKAQFEAATVSEQSDTTFAYFYVNSSGEASIRLPGNYLIQTILMAGGSYAFEDVDAGSADNASMKMDMEAFYAAARDADVFIYNNNKDKTVKDMQSLIARNSLLADCKAVKDGNVWCTGAGVYQQVTAVPGLLEDFHAIVSGEAEGKDELNYLTRLR